MVSIFPVALGNALELEYACIFCLRKFSFLLQIFFGIVPVSFSPYDSEEIVCLTSVLQDDRERLLKGWLMLTGILIKVSHFALVSLKLRV